MLAIRLQRTGRKGHAQFRMVVQDSRRTPTSGRFVYLLGSYNPHTKALAIDKEKAAYYLSNGARPSDRVARLLKNDGVKLPDWVKVDADVERKLRNPEKLRKNQPAEEKVEEPAAPEAGVAEEAPADVAEASVEEAATEEVAAVEPEAPAEEAAPVEEKAEETAEAETPAEEPKEETEKA